MFKDVQFHSPVKNTTIIYTVNSTRHENLLLPQTISQESVCALIFLFPFGASGLLVESPVKAVAGRNPMIVMKTQLTARDALLRPVAAHPVPGPVR